MRQLPNRARDVFPAALAAMSALFLFFGCNSENAPVSTGPPPSPTAVPTPQYVKLHYLPGIVPGSQKSLALQKVGVAPITGENVSGTAVIGGVYNPDLSISPEIKIVDAGEQLRDALIAALGDAGLEAAKVESPKEKQPLPNDLRYVLEPKLWDLRVEKRLSNRVTVHGRYFTMKSMVTLKFSYIDSQGRLAHEITTTGLEEEPPPPKGGEEFLPLETDPQESLSVAMSRAFGQMITDPDNKNLFRRGPAALVTPAPGSVTFGGPPAAIKH